MRSIDDIAAAWVGREDGDRLTPAERMQRDRWLAEDVRHRGAYARAHAVHLHFDRARALGQGFGAEATRSRRTHRRGRWLAALAACVVAAATGMLALQQVVPDHGAPGSGHHLTRIGEVLRLPLADGSAVTLNSGSEVVVEFSAARRQVQLLRGEALFDVAKDRQRPFVVMAAGAEVRAVGTSFSVRRRQDDAVKVVVREGTVDVEADQRTPQRVTANMLAMVSPTRAVQVQPLPARRVQQLLVWREGMIAFDGDTLAQAAAEFARYNDMRILIDDPAVARRTVVGLYSANDPEGFARSVALSMGLQIEHTRGGIHLRGALAQ
ncbi:FecR domain-containing protein [Xanthomonas arboricola]|uniref:FecR family protein n=1 Tax=Xanthomonas arboricola TaxID=56448 RepID=UPI00069FED68|nr:FecR domain-containing protein [Xanthomonas arboricola]AKU51774.1 Fe2+-dicitrate sensor, membrane component [Xanthomonas arboricola pv. juglandis]KOA96521.1 Fe2+-dicitrate sensor, membrane component [Xanthomonas arboricola]KOB04664.1 Fe2+-dicitrate sensor, membrane component [Xanthomonas arboricola]KOB05234.1 Fe2+-dicitrate sensor, membrane component [Xanthomonas arboricola]KOB19412.1 Fe2+-dicitrate sensor, membrane component [Xanthomonas arboricola]